MSAVLTCVVLLPNTSLDVFPPVMCLIDVYYGKPRKCSKVTENTHGALPPALSHSSRLFPQTAFCSTIHINISHCSSISVSLSFASLLAALRLYVLKYTSVHYLWITSFYEYKVVLSQLNVLLSWILLALSKIRAPLSFFFCSNLPDLSAYHFYFNFSMTFSFRYVSYANQFS